MHLGHLFLLISMVSLGFIGIFHKIGSYTACRPAAINVTVFFWAGSFIFLYLVLLGQAQLFAATPSVLYLVAGVCGFLASVAVLAFQAGLQYGKIATSWVIINLSTALPTLLSILVYREAINMAKLGALVLVVVSILLLWKDKQIEERAGPAKDQVAVSQEP